MIKWKKPIENAGGSKQEKPNNMIQTRELTREVIEHRFLWQIEQASSKYTPAEVTEDTAP